MAEDRNLLERAQDYLVSGDFDRDARYVLGPHLSKSLSGLAELMGPGADIKAMVDESKRIVPSLKEGNIPGAVTSLGLAAVAPLLIGAPTDVGKIKKGTEEVTSFLTSRGKNPSRYSWDGTSTQRIHRSPDAHSDKTTAIQPKSGRTIFLDKENAEIVRKFFSSSGEDISILPISKNGVFIPKAKIIRNEDYGPKKAGEVAEITFSPQPKEGLHPFEMASNRSSPGEDMRFSVSTDESGKKVLVGQHMGTPITKIEKGAEEVTKQGKRAKLFQDLADEQRGAPELAMVEAQGKLGGGVLSHAIEHVGDLTHRMTDKYDNFKGYGYDVGNKVDSVLRSLRSEYGFKKEFNENIRAASSYKGIPENRLRGTATKALQRYADAHKNLRVYNEPQKLARDAAVALGEQRFKDAEELLSKLQNLIKGKGVTAQSGENISDAYRRAAGEFDPEFEKTIKKKKGGSVIERNPYNYPPRSI